MILKNVKKFLGLVAISLLLLTGCGALKSVQQPEEVKVAVVGDGEATVWNYVAEKAQKEGIDLQVIKMNDYVQPNIALADGSVDMNAFQHGQYLDEWNKGHDENLQSIGLTFITPLYIFSDKLDDVTDIPSYGKALIPKEPSIQGRALLAFEKLGLIKIEEGKGLQASTDDIIENPRHIQFVAVDSPQAPAMLQDVDVANIGGQFAVDAGLSIDDAIYSDIEYIDEIPKDRFNLIAVRPEDKDNTTYQKIVSLYQSDDVAEKLEEVGKGQYLPVWDKIHE